MSVELSSIQSNDSAINTETRSDLEIEQIHRISMISTEMREDA